MGSFVSRLERAVIDVSWSCHEWFYSSAPGPGIDTCININIPRPPANASRRCRHQLQYIPRGGSRSSSSSTSSSSSSSSSSSATSTSTTSSSSGSHGRCRGAQHERMKMLPPAPPPPPPPPLQPATCRRVPSFPPPIATATSASSDDDWVPVPRRWPSSTCAEAVAADPCRRRRATVSLVYGAQRRHHNHHHNHNHHQHSHHHHLSDEDDGAAAGKPARHAKRPNVPYSTLQAMLFRCTAARNGCLSSKDPFSYPVGRLGRSWSLHNASTNRAATL